MNQAQQYRFAESISSKDLTPKESWLFFTILGTMLRTIPLAFMLTLFVIFNTGHMYQFVTPIYILVGFVFFASLLSSVKIFFLLRWYKKSVLVFEEKGIAGDMVSSKERSESGKKIVPYTTIHSCDIRRSLLGNLLDYVTVAIQTKEDHELPKTSILIPGLSTKEARRLVDALENDIVSFNRKNKRTFPYEK